MDNPSASLQPSAAPLEQEAPAIRPNQVLAIDHIAIAVSDLEAAVDWYTRKLGFKVVEERTTRGESTSMRSTVVVAGSAVVVLVQGATAESPICRFVSKFGPGVHHVAFSVRNMKEIMDQASGAGAAADTALLVDEGLKQLFLRRDPGSGVRVELIGAPE